MSVLRNAKLSNSRYLLVGLLILLVMGALPLAAAANSIDGSSYSGDDAYDLAPGGNPDCDLFARLCFQYSDDSWPGWDRNNAEVVLPV